MTAKELIEQLLKTTDLNKKVVTISLAINGVSETLEVEESESYIFINAR